MLPSGADIRRARLALESITSSNDISFIERALPSRTFNDIAGGSNGRRLGVGVSSFGNDLWTPSAGIFGRNAAGETGDDDESDPITFVGHLTLSPIHTADRAVHSLQGEYLRADTSGIRGSPDFDFDGWYVMGSWVLTGESRRYEFEEARFKNPKPNGIVGKGGIGAWEVLARYSNLDLSDESVDGGEEDNFTFGVNWYPTPNFKFMANYVRVLDLEGGAFDGAEPDAFELHAQAYW